VGLAALGHGDDAVFFAAHVGIGHLVHHLLQGKGHLGDADHLGAAGDAGHEGQIARFGAHHFHQEGLPMGGGGILDAVKRVQGGV
jgi:hypothetical protein